MTGRRRRRLFTLTEVMVAAVLLALASTATIAIIGGSQASVYRAEKRWNDQHITASVIEYYLLSGPKSDTPVDLLPDGYSCTCELFEVDDIHEDAQEAIQGWRLGEYVISVYDSKDELVSETRVRKVLKEEDFE